jgi:hypothetical protein
MTIARKTGRSADGCLSPHSEAQSEESVYSEQCMDVLARVFSEDSRHLSIKTILRFIFHFHLPHPSRMLMLNSFLSQPQHPPVGLPILVNPEGTRPHTNSPPNDYTSNLFIHSKQATRASPNSQAPYELTSFHSRESAAVISHQPPGPRPETKDGLFFFFCGGPPFQFHSARLQTQGPASMRHDAENVEKLTTRRAPRNSSLVSGTQDAFYAVRGIRQRNSI